MVMCEKDVTALLVLKDGNLKIGTYQDLRIGEKAILLTTDGTILTTSRVKEWRAYHDNELTIVTQHTIYHVACTWSKLHHM